jgi:hypothetical protein
MQPSETGLTPASLPDIPRDVLLHHICARLSTAQVLTLLFVSKRLKSVITSVKEFFFFFFDRQSVWESIFSNGDIELLPWLQKFLKYPQCNGTQFSRCLRIAAKGSLIDYQSLLPHLANCLLNISWSCLNFAVWIGGRSEV